MKNTLYIFCALLLLSCGSTENTPERINDRPIVFNEEREQLSLDYMEERYGLVQEHPIIEPKMIVLHWTAIPTFEGSFNAFKDPFLPEARTEISGAGNLNVSTHFLVDRDGTIYRLMPETMMGRHVIGLNHAAIGVENVGGTENTPLTEEQLEANIWLIAYLNSKYDIDYVIGHHEYTHFEGHDLWLEKDGGYRTQKSDPGEYFMRKIRKATRNMQFKPVPHKSLASLFVNSDVISIIADRHEEFKEPSLTERRIKHKDIQPLLENWKEHPDFEVQKVGTSIEGRDLSLVSIGSGDTDVFLWSQMHGDESTATMAIFDIFNFLSSDSFEEEKEALLKNVRLHFLPMLNPDGAEVFQRRNALGIDVNRDALRLQSPEAKTLKRVRDSLDAEFGFNLHDQSRYYNAEGTPKPSTISFLAPAYDFEKSVNEVRGKAMKLIVEMNRELQNHVPGNVGRYNDDFEPRAFGDNIQKWGTSTILIESGGFPDDPEKQEIRKLNFIAILTALFSISSEGYKNIAIDDYEKIPWNNRKLFDLKLAGMKYRFLGDTYILDLGINTEEMAGKDNDFFYRSRIADQGDLSTNYGYETMNVSGYKVKHGKIYPETFADLKALESLDFSSFLSEGYSYVRVKNVPKEENYTKFPVLVVGENFSVPEKLQVGINPTFFLEKDGKLEYVVINGFLQEIGNKIDEIRNGLILR